MSDRDIRQKWIQRIHDHDGTESGPGGIDKWLRLAAATGVAPEELEDDRRLLPGVRYAVDAYVKFVETRPWVEGVASSLTELFSPNLMATRLAAFEKHYTWIDPRRWRTSVRVSRRRRATPTTAWASSWTTASRVRSRNGRRRRCASSAICCGRSSMPSIISA